MIAFSMFNLRIVTGTFTFRCFPGSILGPLVFKIYIADLQDNLSDSISCYQLYDDDTTLYKQCSVKDLAQNVVDFNNSLSHMALWFFKVQSRPKSSES